MHTLQWNMCRGNGITWPAVLNASNEALTHLASIASIWFTCDMEKKQQTELPVSRLSFEAHLPIENRNCQIAAGNRRAKSYQNEIQSLIQLNWEPNEKWANFRQSCVGLWETKGFWHQPFQGLLASKWSNQKIFAPQFIFSTNTPH